MLDLKREVKSNIHGTTPVGLLFWDIITHPPSSYSDTSGFAADVVGIALSPFQNSYSILMWGVNEYDFMGFC